MFALLWGPGPAPQYLRSLPARQPPAASGRGSVLRNVSWCDFVVVRTSECTYANLNGPACHTPRLYTVWPATPGPQAWAARYCMEYCGQCTVWGHTIVIATMSVSDRNLSAPWQSMGPPPYVHAVSQSLTIMQRGTRNYENLVGCHTHCGLPLPCPTPAPCQNSGHNCRL